MKHLRSQGHIIKVMKKRCCVCNINGNKLYCNNHDLACCKSKLSLRSDVNMQTDFSDKQDSSRKRNTFKVIDIDPIFLCGKLKITLEKPVKSKNKIVETKMILDELFRTKSITRKQYQLLQTKCDLWKKCFVNNFHLLY